MSIIKKGTDFGATEQVTSDKLDNLVDNASFTDTSANAVAYTGSTGTCLNGGGLEVTSAGQLQIEDDGVTQAKTSFFSSSTGALTITGGSPSVIFDDTNNVVTNKPFVSGNTTDGGINIRTQEGSSDVRVQAVDKFIAKTTDSPSSDNTDSGNYVDRLEVSSTSGKDQNGNAAAGAKVTGGLYATGDIYADDQVVADHITLKGDQPNITFADDDSSGNLNPEITANSPGGNLAILTKESGSDLYLRSVDNIIFETTDNPGSDYDSSSNDFQPRLFLSHDAGKDENGSAVAGAKVSGGLYVTGDVYADDQVVADHLLLQGTTPSITFNDDDNSGTSPRITENGTRGLDIIAEKGGSDIVIDADDVIVLRNNGTTLFGTGGAIALDADGNDASGAKVTGSLEVTQDVYVTGTARAAAIKIGNDDILDLIHPVGSVISTTTNYANSAAVVADYGGTTWTRFSEGQFAVGYSTTDSDFSAGATGGAKDVTLTAAQSGLPSHSHTLLGGGFDGGSGAEPGSSRSVNLGQTGTTGGTDASSSHENLPPYKVVYMWTRTA